MVMVLFYSVWVLLRTITKFRVSGVSTGCLSAIGHHCRLLRNEVEAREERMDDGRVVSQWRVPAIYLRRFDLQASSSTSRTSSLSVTNVDDHQSPITPHAHHTTQNHDGNGMVWYEMVSMLILVACELRTVSSS